jgi:hypothetical protein
VSTQLITGSTKISWITSTSSPRLRKARQIVPKMKIDDNELNLDAMEEAEYDDTDFDTYDGPQPPKNTILVGVVQKIWWTYTKNEDPMLKVLWVADGNVGEKEQYNGLTIWDNIVLNPAGKFRWHPFITSVGLSLRDIKNKLVVAPEDDNIGAPIEKIGTWTPDTDEAYCRVVTGRERYEGEWQTRAAKYLAYEEPEDDDEEPEAEPEAELEEPEDADVEEEDVEDEDVEDEEEEEEEPAPPPARSRRSAAKPAAAKPAAAKPAATRTAASRSARPAATPAKAPARTGRTARTATAAKPAAATAPARGRRSKPVADDEVPF